MFLLFSGMNNGGYGGRGGGGGGMGGGMNQNFTQDTMGGMGNQGMMFGNQQTSTTQVSIPKDVRLSSSVYNIFKQLLVKIPDCRI